MTSFAVQFIGGILKEDLMFALPSMSNLQRLSVGNDPHSIHRVGRVSGDFSVARCLQPILSCESLISLDLSYIPVCADVVSFSHRQLLSAPHGAICESIWLERCYHAILYIGFPHSYLKCYNYLALIDANYDLGRHTQEQAVSPRGREKCKRTWWDPCKSWPEACIMQVGSLVGQLLERDKAKELAWPVLEDICLSGCGISKDAIADLNRHFKLVLFHTKGPRLTPSTSWVLNSSKAFWA